MSNKLTSLQRDLDHIRKHRFEVKSQQERLASRLSELNKELKAKKISYELYESKYNYLLGGKTSREKKKYFKKRLAAINHREKDLIARIKHETHVSKNKSKLIAITAIMFAIIVPMVSTDIGTLTGFTTYNDTGPSHIAGQAVVPTFFAIELSTELNSGVVFPDLVHGTTNNNAEENNLGTSATDYYLTLDSDSNTNTKSCIKGIDFDGPASLALSTLEWNSSTSSSSSVPADNPGTATTTSFVTSQASISPGSKDYYRFWQHVPYDQIPGNYNTTLTFKLVSSGSAC